MGSIRRHVCGEIGPNQPTEVKKNETMRLGLENPAAYIDDGWRNQSLAIYGRMCSSVSFLALLRFPGDLLRHVQKEN